jgi:imidazole glycerol-phosphate synthase subunit HisH
MKKVAIVDYDMGNIDSVVRAVEECGGDPFIASHDEDFKQAGYIILPGVGSFSIGMNNIRQRQLDRALHEQVIERGVPFLGICLGMQLLADKGWEGGETEGLGWITGEVRRLEPLEKNTRIPHMGWNEVFIKRSCPLFENFPGVKDFYFVHSYHLCCDDEEQVLANTPYCGDFVSAVGKDNIYGVQFHPEKSQKTGFRVLQNFLML